MLPLIMVLEAPPPKSRTPVDDDTEEEADENPAPENKVSGCGLTAHYYNDTVYKKLISQNLELFSWPHYIIVLLCIEKIQENSIGEKSGQDWEAVIGSRK